MAKADQSRRDDAPRAADTRTPLAAYLQLTDQAGALFESAQIARFRYSNRNIGQPIEDVITGAWQNTYLHALEILPQSHEDALLLATHAALMSEMLEGMAISAHDGKLCDGIKAAFDALIDFLARDIGTESVDAVSVELGRTARISMNLVAERRALERGV